MKTIKIKNRFIGNTIFSYTCEGNSTRTTLLEALYSGDNLSGANLSYANLSYADLRGANLSGADLSGANLSYANLSYADLSYANLSYADLRGADLRGANLSYADLSGANLNGADLSGANLSYANLSYADLRGANLSGADLRGADLRGANGIKYSQVSFSGFGESNRLISLIEIDNELIFFCGCFSGNKESLEKYISDGDKEYKKSRILAMETLMTLINN